MARPLQIRRLGVALTLGLAAARSASALTAAPELRSLDLEDLLKVRVVGAAKYEQDQSEVPAAVAVITGEEIRRFGWRTLGDALRTLPGVYTTYNRQYEQVGTRGLGLPGDYNTRLLVTINGNRLNDPVYDGAPGGRDFPLDLDLIERIEFIPGPGGAIYGQNAMFGVVNVVTRSGGSLSGGEASLRLKQPQREADARLSWGGVLDSGMDVLVSVSGLHARGEDLPFSFGASGVKGVARNLDGESTAQAYAHLGYKAWEFEWTHGTRRKDDPTGAYLSTPLLPGQYQRDTFSIGQLRYQTTWGAGWNLSARLFAGAERYEGRFQYEDRFRGFGAGNWWGTEWRLDRTLLQAHHLMIGLEFQDNFSARLGSQTFSRPPITSQVEVAHKRSGVYVQDEWRLGPAVSATLGMRADRNADGSTSFDPRVAVIWKATGATTLKALLGTAHRQPNANESAYEDGVSFVANPGLRRESIQTAELVADHRISDEFVVRGSIFRWSLDDLVVLGTNAASGLSQYQSGPRIHSNGAELSADRSWSSGIRLRGSASFSSDSEARGTSTLNSPRWLARALLAAPLPAAGLRLAYEMRYDDRRRTYTGAFTGGQLVSDLSLTGSAWLPRTDIALNVRNLFDRRYAQPTASSSWQSSLEQDGRSIAVQFQTRF